MGQVKFKSMHEGTPCDVLAGWDYPCRDFFLTVMKQEIPADAEEEDAGCIWSTIYEPSPQDRVTTRHLQDKLVELGIEAPEGFWERVERKERETVYRFSEKGWEQR